MFDAMVDSVELSPFHLNRIPVALGIHEIPTSNPSTPRVLRSIVLSTLGSGEIDSMYAV